MHTLLIINVNKTQLLDMDIGTMHHGYLVCLCPRTFSENEFFFKIINANVAGHHPQYSRDMVPKCTSGSLKL